MELDENPANDNAGLLDPSITDAASSSQPCMKFNLMVKFYNRFGEVKGNNKSKLTRYFINLLFQKNRKPEFTYSILRLLLPAEDRERGNYGIKEKSISVILKEALGLTTEEFERLQHYKNPSYHTKTDGVGVGDFPTVVYTILQKYCTKEGSITIDQVNRTLDELVKKTDQKDQVAIMTKFLKVCTAEEIKWLVRIILKDLKLGIKADVVLKEFHSDAQDYFNLTNSLKQICRKFEDQSVSLKDELMLFQPIKPMLAGKKPLEYFDARQKEYLLETKFDGERLQVHISGSEIKMFSRNGKDYSHIYKELIPLLKSNLNADACILDGQVLVLEKNSLSMVPFGMNKQVALDHDKSLTSNLQICYKVFDCLWVRHDNEQANLMNFALKKRKNIMQKFIKEEKGKLQIVRGDLVSGTEAITERFFKSIERNEQGIILKDPDSFYTPNDRSINWIKLKGDYVQGLTDTLDLIIIGGYYGQSSYRTGNDWTDKITTFLLGVIKKLDVANPRACHIIPFCKVGTGYSESSLNQLRQKLRKAWVKNDRKQPPSYIVGNWKPKIDDKPDCFIDSPNNSVILEIKAAELIKSDTFCAQKTVRFPRVVKIRYDKDWHEAMKFEELEVMMSEKYTKGIKRRSGKAEQESEAEEKEITQKTKKRQANPQTDQQHKKKNTNLDVLQWYKGVEIQQSDIVSDLFKGQEFLVLNLQKEEDKPAIERKILENGGNVAQNPLPTTRFVIVDKLDFKFRTLAYSQNSGSYIFIKPTYIQACVQQSKMLPLTPVHLTVVPRYQAQYFNTRFDIYGDSYSQFLNLRELDCILKQMEMFDPQLDRTLLSKLSKRLQSKVAYYHDLSIEDRVCLRTRGYRLVTDLSDEVTNIILSKTSESKIIAVVNQYLKGTNFRIKVQFIEDLRVDLGFEL